jgi:quinol monooxygenase YgiN
MCEGMMEVNALYTRRELVLAVGALAGAAAFGVEGQAVASQEREEWKMYGLIGKISAVSGQRDTLAAILLEGTKGMPGCLSYIVASDASDPDALWVTEVWESEERHRASLKLPAVQAAIGKGRPLIAGFGDRVVTHPLGGQGLPGAPRK